MKKHPEKLRFPIKCDHKKVRFPTKNHPEKLRFPIKCNHNCSSLKK